ncbi:hypothetical protein DE146DRAFT_784622 [Phaeosphaeria sp. MPI-PUGE-AT-0046c]|nr:hypothetical protein DE146DRAFT_784622 [Phaeosphaeria sp. MPI-PUGE-AT-0046c]
MAAYGRHTPGLLSQLYHHVVLPRNVPSREDRNLHNIESELARRLTHAVKSLVEHTPLDDLPSLDTIRLALSTCSVLNVDGKIEKNMLLKEMRQLDSQKALILHVTEQNAALLIYSDRSIDGVNSVIFEIFETSATSEHVLAAENALQWDFPGQALSIPHDTFTGDADFQRSLCTFLEQASVESIKQFSAVTYKACAPLPEIRDTPDPTLISGALAAILEANGKIHTTTLLRKRVRDTVSFENAHKPWRRSALYLALRVALQRLLYRNFGPEKGLIYYKVTLCVFMSHLLNDGLHTIPNEASHLLRQKLGRRLAKLSLDVERGSRISKILYNYLCRTLHNDFQKTLELVEQTIESEWNVYRRKTSRFIWTIPPNASENDLSLPLPVSGPYIFQAINSAFTTTQAEIRSASELLGHYNNSKALKPFITTMKTYLPLYAYEETTQVSRVLDTSSDASRCTKLAATIGTYISTVQDAYAGYPEFTSRLLLKLFLLWMELDISAVRCFPLLAEYHPVFEAEMLDVLQLFSPEELEQLHEIQSYLCKRCNSWQGKGSRTIFDTPAQDSFAARYFVESNESDALLRIRDDIEQEAQELLEEKEEEWQEMSDAHEAKMCKMAVVPCVYVTEFDDHGISHKVHQKGCPYHRLKWEAKQIEIEILEHPLPKSESVRRAIIFELSCPKPFAAYRDATWLILSTFGFPKPEQVATPSAEPSEAVAVIRSYEGLSRYANNTQSRVTLGSTTKSHLKSHYSKSGFPVDFPDICRAFGLRLDYYDSAMKIFTKREMGPSFAHLFPLKLPPSSPYLGFQPLGDTTSNRILATQTRCPTDVNVHEYISWQSLLLGTYSRWPSLLRELGSTNLSFSTDSTWAVVSRLVLQVGPTSSSNVLRDCHSILDDSTFCQQLLDQVDYRLEAIRRNWREPVQMDILISILLKTISFNSDYIIYNGALELLAKSSTITQDWCTKLQALEHENEFEPSNFAIWAAILCKRTLHPKLTMSHQMARQDLLQYITASILLQNCLNGDFDTLPYNLRNAVLRDLSSQFRIRNQLDQAMRIYPDVLLHSLQSFWPVPPDCLDRATSTSYDIEHCWITVSLLTKEGRAHHVHYNYVHGTLLINGQQLGLLPPEYRRWPIIEQLVGSQGLRMYPSGMPGMSIVIARQMPCEHWVHLGFRANRLVIRADHRGTILELIPSFMFGNEHRFDLPATLTERCFHWLNLRTREIEIRQVDPWKYKKSNWRLNLTSPRARATRNNGSTLVDPNCELAKKIAQNFHFFEYPKYITVYKPRGGNLRVELKRLELDFVVWQGGLLLSPQLGAVIAETRYQDVGTWYGLKSKLVVRSIKDPTQRSILLPIGEYTTEPEYSHISIVIKNHGEYLKFSVNDVLGRIDCPAEPIMLYQRALWHAVTSHFIPDSLTNRTGTEEALQYLSSGAYRPWTPLSPGSVNLLLNIAKLSPPRVYYPATLKSMETVQWNTRQPTVIQDDRYRRVVNMIFKRHFELTQFTNAFDSNQSTSPITVAGDTHLENRALCRITSNPSGDDLMYQPRDRHTTAVERANTGEVATLIANWPTQVANTTHLADLLVDTPIIGGYVKLFDKIIISDILHTDLGFEWGALVRTALTLSQDKKFEMTFLFSILAFSQEIDIDLLRAVISFSLLSDLKTIPLPEAVAYSHYKIGEGPHLDKFIQVISGAKRMFAIERNTASDQQLMRQLDHEHQASIACKLLAEAIMAQWPSEVLEVDKLPMTKDTLLDRELALDLVRPVWGRLVDNRTFSQHLGEVQLILSRYAPDSQAKVTCQSGVAFKSSQLYPLRMRGGDHPSMAEILEKDIEAKVAGTHNLALRTLPNGRTDERLNGSSNNPWGTHKLRQPSSEKSLAHRGGIQKHVLQHVRELRDLVAPLATSSSLVQKRYGAELQQSIVALQDRLMKPDAAAQEPYNPTKMETDIRRAKDLMNHVLAHIRRALQKDDSRAKWLDLVGLWPKATLTSLLASLRSTSGVDFGAGVRTALVDLGVAVTYYQRLLRIREAAQNGRTQQLVDERANEGHTNWSPTQYVDWLLLEIDGNILIRPEQVEVALATISPTSRRNSVLQLLMGKGKTSCILPMVAVMLSHKNLFRIVVPRPLLLQSAQLMQAKLGGLLDREVLHIPFSRKTPTNKPLMQTYCQLHTYAQKSNGIILALPEHILSFKLSGLQRLCDGKVEEAATMIKAQAWLDRHARDVLDECDVSLAIRTQLIYPSGSQQTVDGHPLRWQTVEALLDLIASYLDDLTMKFPNSVEIVFRSGFPLIYFLRKDVEDYLLGQMLQKISRGQTVILPVSASSPTNQQAIYEFMSMPVVEGHVVQRIQEMFQEKRHLVDAVYHLRGLFVHRILLSTLKKRWNVQYGLNPARDPIAVPYQAKGVPSLTAEWGHPDVAIILTCLSFYYEGLSMAHFRQAIEHLAKSNEPSIEYSLWVTEGVPEAFQNYNAINVEDAHQLRELHLHIRYMKPLLDYYMNSFVFPQHAKQFSKKLSASGSDLVVYNPTNPTCRVSGFSGTNDTRHQLPMTIKQNDLPQLAHTNAEVLAYLLEDRNRRYVRMVDASNKRLSEDGLLKKLMHPHGFRYLQNTNMSNAPDRLRILIDAGAQILEYDNRSLAKAWLKEDHEATAAVYFDEDHRARVIYGKGTDVPLVASPFADNLEKCLVYLDESHCRGTDLKLPPHARAAVTLGPHLTKDALVQAAMRLRLLGKTQSVTFFSPPEVHQSILDLREAAKTSSPSSPITSADVIRWLLEQTCNGIEQLEPLYFNQGLNYLLNTQAKLEHPDFLQDSVSRNVYLSVVRSQELQTLKQLYEPKHQQRGSLVKVSAFVPCLRAFASELLQRRKGFQDRGHAIHASALEEVEQEREMEFEVEAVREVQAPFHFKALKVASKLHPDIEQWATTGRMSAGSDAYQPMFYALQKTAVGMRNTITATGKAAHLHVSTQFSRTVSVPEVNDGFLRPCHWLLLDHRHGNALLVSPEEANALFPILQHLDVDQAVCHLVVYAAPVTRRMLQFNNLDYYAVPPLPKDFRAPIWLKVELGIFAGRLYFDWNEYKEILSYLGVCEENGCGDDVDTGRASKKEFATKPLEFLHDWLAVRRKGQDFEHTPMGFITTGKPLSGCHPFFAAASAEVASSDKLLQPFETHVTPVNEEDEEESGDDEDHVKEHLFQQSGDMGNGQEMFHDAEEEWSETSETENTFLESKDYIDTEEEEDDNE